MAHIDEEGGLALDLDPGASGELAGLALSGEWRASADVDSRPRSVAGEQARGATGGPY